MLSGTNPARLQASNDGLINSNLEKLDAGSSLIIDRQKAQSPYTGAVLRALLRPEYKT